MRVTFVSPSAYPTLVPSGIEFAGGAEFQQVILARALQRRGHEVSFVVGDYGQPAVVDAQGITLYRSFRLFAGNRKLRFIPDMRKLRRALRQSRPDVVNQRSTSFYTGQCCYFSHEAGAAFSFSLGIDYNCYRNLLGRTPWPIQRAYRWGVEHAELVLAQTRQQQTIMADNFDCSPRVLSNMLELPAPRTPDEEQDYVLWVGSLARRKRPELFVELARALPHTRFVLVGGPGEDDGFDREIEESARDVDNLEMRGFVAPSDMAPLYRGARLYVNTSWLEGLPNTYLQSWSHGVPVVTISVDPDGVIQSKNLGATAGDLPGLVSRVEELLDDAALRREMGENSRSHVAENHDVEALAPRAEAMLLEVVRL